MQTNRTFLAIIYIVTIFIQTEARTPRFSDYSSSDDETMSDGDADYDAMLDRMIEELLGMQLGSLVPLQTTQTPNSFFDLDTSDIEDFDNQGDDGVSPVWLPFYVIAPKTEPTKRVERPQTTPPTVLIPKTTQTPKPRTTRRSRRHFTTTTTTIIEPYLVPDEDTFAYIDREPSQKAPNSFHRQLKSSPPRPPPLANSRPLSHNNGGNKITSSDPLRCKVNIVDVHRCYLGTASSCQASSWTVDVTVASVTNPTKYGIHQRAAYLPTYISSVSVGSASPVTNQDDRNYWNKFIQRTSVVNDDDSSNSSPLEIRMRVETSCCLRQLKIDWIEASSYGTGAHDESRSCELDLCNGNFCLNRGVCTPTSLCFCQEGWSGKHCERTPFYDEKAL